MNERGYSFQKVDLYKSSASDFIIEGNTLIPPFNSIPGLGTNAALNIVKARKKETSYRRKISSKEVKYLKQLSST